MTKRIEFDPISTTETGAIPGRRPWASDSTMQVQFYLSVQPESRLAISFGALEFKASPRPDRLGLVMKYCCALNGSSPLRTSMRRDVPSGNIS